MSAAKEAGDQTFVRRPGPPRTMTSGQVVELLQEIATRLEAEKAVSFRTKDAIRLLVNAVTEALK